MKKKISNFSRCLLAVAAISLVIALFYPLWSIELSAPQYPEGLTLLLYPNKIGGDLTVINGLNHYIGMKTLHTDDFFEFKILPYIIGFFALASFAVILLKRRKYFFTLFGAYILFTIVSVIDFYRWTYNYGHDLNPESAIKIPGMSYQPPLIGYKKLLNMEVFSWPDIGGYILCFVAIVLFIVFLRETVILKKIDKKKALSLVLGLGFLFSCSSSKAPEAIKMNVDQCEYCKMIISNTKYGAELITQKGRIYKFDDISCLINYRKANRNLELASFYVLDYTKENQLIEADQAYYLAGGDIHTPMAGGMIAIGKKEEAESLKEELMAEDIAWSDIENQWKE